MQYGVRIGCRGNRDEPQLPHHYPGRAGGHTHSGHHPHHVQVQIKYLYI